MTMDDEGELRITSPRGTVVLLPYGPELSAEDRALAMVEAKRSMVKLVQALARQHAWNDHRAAMKAQKRENQ